MYEADERLNIQFCLRKKKKKKKKSNLQYMYICAVHVAST